MKKILITGGAGFAGSSLALLFASHFPGSQVLALDNLKRRGSELSLPRLRDAGVTFVHGDVRCREDLLELPQVDLIIDCAAEPSVLAGADGSPDYVIQTNLSGTLNCLELARRHGAALVFLSTSRVYPVESLNALKFAETPTRFELQARQDLPGASDKGISEDFPLAGARSIYGASKLCSELMIQEYAAAYGIKAIINRCGVLSGPWQMGKVDQGVIVLWAARHFFGGELSYLGYGGTGKQVRDVLHISDLFELLARQLRELDSWTCETFNVGGGAQGSISLCELTKACQEATGKRIAIRQDAEGRQNDIKSYITDSSKAAARFDWSPQRTPKQIVEDVVQWIAANADALRPILS